MQGYNVCGRVISRDSHRASVKQAIWQIFPLSNTISRYKHCPYVVAFLAAKATARSNNCTKYHGGRFEIIVVVSVKAAVFRDMT